MRNGVTVQLGSTLKVPGIAGYAPLSRAELLGILCALEPGKSTHRLPAS
jgi:hypothetical protein